MLIYKMEIISNFAVLEGQDGCGSTTQLSILKKRLKGGKNDFFWPTSEPTDSKIGRIIRSALKNETPMKPQTICMLFAADRNEHLKGTGGIIEQAGGGKLVISDRFALSSLVYQGIECGDELPKLLNSGFPFPEITIFLEIKPEIAIERMKKRKVLDIYEHLDFQKKVYDKYAEQLDNYKKAGAKVEVIDASKDEDEVSAQIWEILAKMPILRDSEILI